MLLEKIITKHKTNTQLKQRLVAYWNEYQNKQIQTRLRSLKTSRSLHSVSEGQKETHGNVEI